MKAVGSYILITKQKDSNERESGFITQTNSRYKKGQVVSSGSLVSSVSEGDFIYYDSTQGHDHTIDNIQYRVITERDVAVIV